MKVYNPHNLPTIDIRTVKPLQENLKDLHTENHDKLLRVLTKRGFRDPIKVWKNGDDYFLLDGHQRQRVIMMNELEPHVPMFLAEASTKEEAIEMLLETTSQYGTITVDGLDELAALYDLDTDELDINFDAVNVDKLFDDLEEPEEEKAKDDSPKETRYTVEELRTEVMRFTDQTTFHDNGFVEWLASRK